MDILFGMLMSGGFSFLIAHFLGRKRQIGFGWSLFFCLILSPIVGFIITMLSRKYYRDNPSKSVTKKIFGWIFIIIGILAMLGTISDDSISNQPIFVPLAIQFGAIALGYYLIQIGSGARFDDDLMKVDQNVNERH